MKHKQKPGLYVGRKISFTVCDGYAQYQIVEIRHPDSHNLSDSGECVVSLVPDLSGYEFEGAYTNRRGELVLPLPVVENNIKWADEFSKILRS